MDDLDKYVLEQAKVEVEHTRSWPTKILAFYVAINAGIVTAVFSLTSRAKNPVTPSMKVLLTVALVGVAAWAIYLFAKNHKNYLRSRNLQVQFQTVNEKAIGEKYAISPEWVKLYEVSLCTRWSGWGFYAFLVFLVATLGVAGVWLV